MTPDTIYRLCERIRSAQKLVRDVRAALEGERERADRLRRAHLLHVYDGELSTGCGICACHWEPGEDEVHDADCIASPEGPP